MLRLLRQYNLKLRGLSVTDLSCHMQAFCADSTALPERSISLRRRRRLRRETVKTDERDAELTDADIDGSSQMTNSKQHPGLPSDLSVESLQKQLRDAYSAFQGVDGPEFPSDVLAQQKSEELSQINQARHAFRPRIDPMDTSVVLFPGQGSQFVGMGAKLLAHKNAEKLYKTASNILGYNLLDVCLHGPKDVLSKTAYSQPAVLVTSLAAVEKLKEVCPRAIENCITTVGYDVGEYAALVFAGAMSFEDAVRVVKVRASAMQAASLLVSGGMMKVYFGASGRIKSACHLAKQYCKQELGMDDCVCEITTFLYPGCKIISGHREALEFIEKNRQEFGIRRIDHVPASGGFHSRLMHPTLSAITRAVAAVDLREPVIPVHCNVTGLRYRTVDSIRQQLVNQLWKPIRWEQIMHIVYGRSVGAGFPVTFEVGPGRMLGFLLQQVNAKAYSQYNHVQVKDWYVRVP